MSISVLKNNQLTVSISTHGAEIVSVIDRNGKERIWQGREGVWSEHAPILFPICGGLRDDCYYIDGRAYTLPKHGFAKNAEWTLCREHKNTAAFMLNEKTAGFPFEYKLFAEYTLTDNRIEVEYKCINEDERTFWYCIGSHEGYTIVGELEDCALELENSEDIYLSSQIGNLLVPEEYLFARNVSSIPLKREYFAKGAMIMRSIKSRSITLTEKGCRRARVDFPDMGVIILWTKPGEKFLCIEPWTGAPDFITSDGVFAHKSGNIELRPGKDHTSKHEICIFADY